MSAAGDADLLTAARSALLDALAALAPHRQAVVLVGAQAVYLQTGDAPVALAEATKDCDLVLDPRELNDDPLIEHTMTEAGFRRTAQPGGWISPRGIPVDLMVPEALSGTGGNRGARIPPHHKHSTRRTPGLEAAVVDNQPTKIAALDPRDHRTTTVAVAGPAALLVAKLYKLGERQRQPGRLLDKDAHDIYRLLVATDTATIGGRLIDLERNALAGPTTTAAIGWLRELFGHPVAIGSTMAGRAEELIGDPEMVAASVAALTGDVLAVIDSPARSV
jgi:hypothetical protein